MLRCPIFDIPLNRINLHQKFESLYYSQHCKLEQAHCRIVCNSAWQSIVKINQSETNCDQLKDDDGLCGHKDPQRLEHLSKESCLQIKRELRKSSVGVATTKVNEQLRVSRRLVQVIDHCTLCTLACPSKRLELICTTRKVNNMGQLPQISQLLVHYHGINTIGKIQISTIWYISVWYDIQIHISVHE